MMIWLGMSYIRGISPPPHYPCVELSTNVVLHCICVCDNGHVINLYLTQRGNKISVAVLSTMVICVVMCVWLLEYIYLVRPLIPIPSPTPLGEARAPVAALPRWQFAYIQIVRQQSSPSPSQRWPVARPETPLLYGKPRMAIDCKLIPRWSFYNLI